MKKPGLDLYSRAAQGKSRSRAAIKPITLGGGMFAAGGKVFASKAEAEIAAAKLGERAD